MFPLKNFSVTTALPVQWKQSLVIRHDFGSVKLSLQKNKQLPVGLPQAAPLRRMRGYRWGKMQTAHSHHTCSAEPLHPGSSSKDLNGLLISTSSFSAFSFKYRSPNPSRINEALTQKEPKNLISPRKRCCPLADHTLSFWGDVTNQLLFADIQMLELIRHST